MSYFERIDNFNKPQAPRQPEPAIPMPVLSLDQIAAMDEQANTQSPNVPRGESNVVAQAAPKTKGWPKGKPRKPKLATDSNGG